MSSYQTSGFGMTHREANNELKLQFDELFESLSQTLNTDCWSQYSCGCTNTCSCGCFCSFGCENVDCS